MLAIQLHFTKFKLLNLFLIFKFNRLNAGCLMPKCFIPLPLLGDLPHSGHTQASGLSLATPLNFHEKDS